jgi:hypothetical protein
MTTRPLGRPPQSVLGITAVGWAGVTGSPTDAALRRARNIVSGRQRLVDPTELCTIAAHHGVDLAELVRALASLHGYLPPDAPAGDPDRAVL